MLNRRKRRTFSDCIHFTCAQRIFFFLSWFDLNPAARSLLVVSHRNMCSCKMYTGQRQHLDSQRWTETLWAEMAGYRRSPLFFQAGLFFAQERTYLQCLEAADVIPLFIIYYSYKLYLDLADPATVCACWRYLLLKLVRRKKKEMWEEKQAGFCGAQICLNLFSGYGRVRTEYTLDHNSK